MSSRFRFSGDESGPDGTLQRLEEYAVDHGGECPESLEALVIPDENGEAYLRQESIPLDPWGRHYGYDSPSSDRNRPRVYSLGEDGVIGGEGDDADIDSLTLLGVED